MNNTLVSTENILEQGKSIVKTVSNHVKKTTQAAQNQISGARSDTTKNSDPSTKRFLQDIYGTTNSQSPSPVDLENTKKSDEARRAQLRQILHSKYFQSLNQPQKQKPRPQEKIEQEKKQDEQLKFEKESKKSRPIAVTRSAQRVEVLTGAGG